MQPPGRGLKELGGYICVCNDRTFDEAVEGGIFGLPESQLASLASVKQHMPVFLFNSSARTLHGIFAARGPGAANISATAFNEGDAQPTSLRYPAQVAVEIREVCGRLGEAQLRPVVPRFLQARTHCELTPAETLALCRLFWATKDTNEGLQMPHGNVPLRKVGADLAGVIFTCNSETGKTCLGQHIFGLPAPHASYVRRIHPGMPVFLLNYDNRSLQGVFRAASYGGLNLDPSVWPNHGASNGTRYPAQVKVQPDGPQAVLAERDFRPALASAYQHNNRHFFFFELNQQEVSALLELFAKHHAQALADSTASGQAARAAFTLRMARSGAISSAPTEPASGPAAAAVAGLVAEAQPASSCSTNTSSQTSKKPQKRLRHWLAGLPATAGVSDDRQPPEACTSAGDLVEQAPDGATKRAKVEGLPTAGGDDMRAGSSMPAPRQSRLGSPHSTGACTPALEAHQAACRAADQPPAPATAAGTIAVAQDVDATGAKVSSATTALAAGAGDGLQAKDPCAASAAVAQPADTLGSNLPQTRDSALCSLQPSSKAQPDGLVAADGAPIPPGRGVGTKEGKSSRWQNKWLAFTSGTRSQPSLGMEPDAQQPVADVPSLQQSATAAATAASGRPACTSDAGGTSRIPCSSHTSTACAREVLPPSDHDAADGAAARRQAAPVAPANAGHARAEPTAAEHLSDDGNAAQAAPAVCDGRGPTQHAAMPQHAGPQAAGNTIDPGITPAASPSPPPSRPASRAEPSGPGSLTAGIAWQPHGSSTQPGSSPLTYLPMPPLSDFAAADAPFSHLLRMPSARGLLPLPGHLSAPAHFHSQPPHGLPMPPAQPQAWASSYAPAPSAGQGLAQPAGPANEEASVCGRSFGQDIPDREDGSARPLTPDTEQDSIPGLGPAALAAGSLLNTQPAHASGPSTSCSPPTLQTGVSGQCPSSLPAGSLPSACAAVSNTSAGTRTQSTPSEPANDIPSMQPLLASHPADATVGPATSAMMSAIIPGLCPPWFHFSAAEVSSLQPAPSANMPACCPPPLSGGSLLSTCPVPSSLPAAAILPMAEQDSFHSVRPAIRADQVQHVDADLEVVLEAGQLAQLADADLALHMGRLSARCSLQSQQLQATMQGVLDCYHALQHRHVSPHASRTPMQQLLDEMSFEGLHSLVAELRSNAALRQLTALGVISNALDTVAAAATAVPALQPNAPEPPLSMSSMPAPQFPAAEQLDSPALHEVGWDQQRPSVHVQAEGHGAQPAQPPLPWHAPGLHAPEAQTALQRTSMQQPQPGIHPQPPPGIPTYASVPAQQRTLQPLHASAGGLGPPQPPQVAVPHMLQLEDGGRPPMDFGLPLPGCSSVNAFWPSQASLPLPPRVLPRPAQPAVLHPSAHLAEAQPAAHALPAGDGMASLPNLPLPPWVVPQHAQHVAPNPDVRHASAQLAAHAMPAGFVPQPPVQQPWQHDPSMHAEAFMPHHSWMHVMQPQQTSLTMRQSIRAQASERFALQQQQQRQERQQQQPPQQQLRPQSLQQAAGLTADGASASIPSNGAAARQPDPASGAAETSPIPVLYLRHRQQMITDLGGQLPTPTAYKIPLTEAELQLARKYSIKGERSVAFRVAREILTGSTDPEAEVGQEILIELAYQLLYDVKVRQKVVAVGGRKKVWPMKEKKDKKDRREAALGVRDVGVRKPEGSSGAGPPQRPLLEGVLPPTECNDRLAGKTYLVLDTNIYLHPKGRKGDVAARFVETHQYLGTTDALFLVPQVVMHELRMLALDRKASHHAQLVVQHHAQLVVKLLDGYRSSSVVHFQKPEERFVTARGGNHVRARPGDTGILDCIRYFQSQGATVELCTMDRKFLVRAQRFAVPIVTTHMVQGQLARLLDKTGFIYDAKTYQLRLRRATADTSPGSHDAAKDKAAHGIPPAQVADSHLADIDPSDADAAIADLRCPAGPVSDADSDAEGEEEDGEHSESGGEAGANAPAGPTHRMGAAGRGSAGASVAGCMHAPATINAGTRAIDLSLVPGAHLSSALLVGASAQPALAGHGGTEGSTASPSANGLVVSEGWLA